jgi:DNA-binding MarR family transcriptional regulator
VDREELNNRIYRCLQEITVLLDDGDRAAMRDAGLTPTHFNLLRVLESGPEAEGLTITRLAELTLCTRGNVTRVVQRLVEAGLVEIRSDRSDQRLVRVRLTEFGADRLDAAEHAHSQLNSDRLGDIGEDEIADLLARLTALTGHLRNHLADR